MILNKRGTMSAVLKRMSAADDGRKACRRWSEVQRALPRSALCGRLAAASHETSATRSADGMVEATAISELLVCVATCVTQRDMLVYMRCHTERQHGKTYCNLSCSCLLPGF